MARGVPDLEPGEELRAMAGASFRGGFIATVKTTFAFGSARVRNNAFEDWKLPAEKAGFPTAGPEAILAVTRRLMQDIVHALVRDGVGARTLRVGRVRPMSRLCVLPSTR